MTALISLVLARADNGIIGKKGGLPWRIADDMAHFKTVTMGKPIVMGRRTWESLPRKPLPGRANIVITRDANFTAGGAKVVHSLDDAIIRAQDEGAAEIAIIGGAEIYNAALPRADRIHLTEVHHAFEGDTSIPDFDRVLWHETARENRETADGLRYSFVTLDRK